MKLDYKSGFVGIYKEVSRELLPIALNSGLFWPKHSFIIKPGKITVGTDEIIMQQFCLRANFIMIHIWWIKMHVRHHIW